MFERVIHKWLKIPYSLHVHYIQRPRRPRATVLFIHGIGNSGAVWQEVIEQLPNDVRIITIDLLGFGRSPRPDWAVYSARTQAASVIATLVKLRITSPLIVVGHSLGSLVAVEMTKRYSLIVRSLILCSPPFYRPDSKKVSLLPNSDQLLRNIYKIAHKRPQQLIKLSAVAAKLGLIHRDFKLTAENTAPYLAALEASIINQTSFEDIQELAVPISIIRGTLDPVVVKRNIKYLAKTQKNISLHTVIAGHEINGLFVPAVVKQIASALPPPKKRGIVTSR